MYVFLDLLRGSLPWTTADGRKGREREVSELKQKHLDEPFMSNIVLNIQARRGTGPHLGLSARFTLTQKR
jgi:hypothetical protein